MLPASSSGWTGALQDMRLAMNITSKGNSRKDIFELHSANDTFTRYVSKPMHIDLSIYALHIIDLDTWGYLAWAAWCTQSPA